MQKIKDEIGNKYGKLTVVSFSHMKNRLAMWVCKCDCGNEIITAGSDLRRKSTTSCGCGKRLPYKEASFNQIYRSYKHGALSRKLEFSLSEDFFKDITSKDCFYCGKSPSNKANQPSLNGYYFYNGIDRIDNTKGYIEENVVPCCGICNRAKRDMTIDDFYEYIYRLVHKYS